MVWLAAGVEPRVLAEAWYLLPAWPAFLHTMSNLFVACGDRPRSEHPPRRTPPAIEPGGRARPAAAAGISVSEGPTTGTAVGVALLARPNPSLGANGHLGR